MKKKVILTIFACLTFSYESITIAQENLQYNYAVVDRSVTSLPSFMWQSNNSSSIVGSDMKDDVLANKWNSIEDSLIDVFIEQNIDMINYYIADALRIVSTNDRRKILWTIELLKNIDTRLSNSMNVTFDPFDVVLYRLSNIFFRKDQNKIELLTIINKMKLEELLDRLDYINQLPIKDDCTERQFQECYDFQFIYNMLKGDFQMLKEIVDGVLAENPLAMKSITT